MSKLLKKYRARGAMGKNRVSAFYYPVYVFDFKREFSY